MKSSTGRLPSDEVFSAHLSSLMEGCYIADIDPAACIPLCLMREVLQNAVKKLKLILSGKSKSPSVLLPGYVSSSPSSLVVPLEEELKYLLYQYWESVLETKEEAEATIAVHKRWYGIVDGCQIHEAVIQLRTEIPRDWAHFQWKVTVLRESAPVHMLRSLARVQNELNKKDYVYEVTIYDLLHGLRMEYDLLL